MWKKSWTYCTIKKNINILKNISKKSIDDLTAEQKIEQRYQRLVEEVRAGKLDLQTLTHAEAEIVQKLINE